LFFGAFGDRYAGADGEAVAKPGFMLAESNEK
jgi:hypothetical protein